MVIGHKVIGFLSMLSAWRGVANIVKLEIRQNFPTKIPGRGSKEVRTKRMVKNVGSHFSPQLFPNIPDMLQDLGK